MQTGMWPIGPWSYPDKRYYDEWFGTKSPDAPPSDHEIKSTVVDRLKDNPNTRDDDIRVDVKEQVVTLAGEVTSWLAKRAAGDDAWDTPGVLDVNNELVAGRSDSP